MNGIAQLTHEAYGVDRVDIRTEEKRWDDWPSPVLGKSGYRGVGDSTVTGSRRVGCPTSSVERHEEREKASK